MREKGFAHILVLILLLTGLIAGVYLTTSGNPLKLFSLAAENKSKFLKGSEKPQFVPGELIFKLKKDKPVIKPKASVVAQGISLNKKALDFNQLDPGSVPQVLNEINQKNKINTVEKVFKGSPRQTYKLALATSEKKKLSEALEKLLESSQVEFVSPNYILKTNLVPNDIYYLDHYPGQVENRETYWNPSFDYQWGLKKIGMEKAWGVATGSAVVVGVVDSGIDYTHPDLGSCTLDQVRNNLCAKVAPGYNFVSCDEYDLEDFTCILPNNPDDDAMDDHGHGTHVAGTIISGSNNSQGVAGINWSGRVLPVKVLNKQGIGSLSDILGGLQFAVDNGASVINMSFGGLDTTSQPGGITPYDDVFTQAENSNILLVAAAGNSTEDITSGYYPANHPKVMAVGASDHQDQIATFSNFGSKLSVTAPGVDILSLRAKNTDMYNGSTGYSGQRVIGDNYYYLSGTSMAAPHVAGLAALLLSKNPALIPLQLQSIIEYSAADLGASGFDTHYGWGRIDAGKALSLQIIPPLARILQPATGTTIYDKSVQIIGSAQAEDFQNYTIQAGIGAAPSSWSTTGITLVSNGTNPVANGLLGNLDTTSYADKNIVIKLEVNSRSGLKRQSFAYVSASRQIPFESPSIVNSHTATVAAYPAAVSTGNSNLYVSWFYIQDRNSPNAYFNKSSNAGKNFTPDLALTSEASSSALSSLSLQTLGNDIVVSFGKSPKADLSTRAKPGVPMEIVLVKSSDGGATFPIRQSINTDNMMRLYSSDINYMPRIHSAVDKNRNFVYLVWQAGSTLDSNGYVYFARFNNQTNIIEQTKIVRIVNSNLGDPNPLPAISVGNNGKIYVVWSEANLGDFSSRRINLITSSDFGDSFTEPRIIHQSTDLTCEENQPELTVDEQNAMYVAFFAADVSCLFPPYLWMTKSVDGGSSFSPLVNLTPTIRGYGLLSISAPVVAGDHIFIAAVPLQPAPIYLIQANKKLTDISAPAVVPGSGASSYIFLSALTGGGNKNVYLVRDEASVANRTLTSRIVSTRTAFPETVSFPVSQSVSLSTGDNLIGLIVDKGLYKASDLINELNRTQAGTVIQISRWKDDRWDPYIANFSANNFDIKPGEGYLIKSSRNAQINLLGNKAILSSLTIGPGFNAISLPEVPTLINTAQKLVNEMKKQGINISTISRWKDGGWKSYVPNFPAGSFEIKPGEGYYLRSATNEYKTFNIASSSASVSSFSCNACIADINKDKNVNISDISLWSYCRVRGINSSSRCSNADITKECLISQFGKKCSN